jgi:hypothetical protein
MTAEDERTWSDVKDQLFNSDTETRSSKEMLPTQTKKRKREIFRFIIQYPAEKTASANPGRVGFKEYGSCKEKCNCEQHDLLVTIDGKNARTLFVSDGVQIFDLAKGDRENTYE